MKILEALVSFKDQYGKVEGDPKLYLFAYEWRKQEKENFDLDQQIFYYLDSKEEIKDFLGKNNGNSEFFVSSYTDIGDINNI